MTEVVFIDKTEYLSVNKKGSRQILQNIHRHSHNICAHVQMQ